VVFQLPKNGSDSTPFHFCFHFSAFFIGKIGEMKLELKEGKMEVVQLLKKGKKEMSPLRGLPFPFFHFGLENGK